jgi:hypothetical protein
LHDVNSDVSVATLSELTQFSEHSLQLPSTATHYDRILLSLRKKDAIFTFNWDPFLFDAYVRNMNMGISLPAIFFLHGNVRMYPVDNPTLPGKDGCYKQQALLGTVQHFFC